MRFRPSGRVRSNARADHAISHSFCRNCGTRCWFGNCVCLRGRRCTVYMRASRGCGGERGRSKSAGVIAQAFTASPLPPGIAEADPASTDGEKPESEEGAVTGAERKQFREDFVEAIGRPQTASLMAKLSGLPPAG